MRTGAGTRKAEPVLPPASAPPRQTAIACLDERGQARDPYAALSVRGNETQLAIAIFKFLRRACDQSHPAENQDAIGPTVGY
ncbi:MAG: hypothetical protein CTY20_06170 [Hyphomicrobium sp.]|nr:MAG: hypothetical protein CTY20_06170 [Hyphomicrobium sp.]